MNEENKGGDVIKISDFASSQKQIKLKAERDLIRNLGLERNKSYQFVIYAVNTADNSEIDSSKDFSR